MFGNPTISLQAVVSDSEDLTLSIEYAVFRWRMQYEHRPSLYTLRQTNCDFTVRSHQWQFQCEQISSSPPQLLLSSRPWQRSSQVSTGLPILWSLGASVNQLFKVLRGRQLLLLFVSSQVVQVAVGEDQRCRAVFPPHPGHAFQHLAMQDVANGTLTDIAYWACTVLDT